MKFQEYLRLTRNFALSESLGSTRNTYFMFKSNAVKLICM